jgi:hypothetical protein
MKAALIRLHIAVFIWGFTVGFTLRRAVVLPGLDIVQAR